jgi:hypothetical protein
MFEETSLEKETGERFESEPETVATISGPTSEKLITKAARAEPVVTTATKQVATNFTHRENRLIFNTSEKREKLLKLAKTSQPLL